MQIKAIQVTKPYSSLLYKIAYSFTLFSFVCRRFWCFYCWENFGKAYVSIIVEQFRPKRKPSYVKRKFWNIWNQQDFQFRRNGNSLRCLKLIKLCIWKYSYICVSSYSTYLCWNMRLNTFNAVDSENLPHRKYINIKALEFIEFTVCTGINHRIGNNESILSHNTF